MSTNPTEIPKRWRAKLRQPDGDQTNIMFAAVFAESEDQAREIIRTLLHPSVTIDWVKETATYPLILVGGYKYPAIVELEGS